MKVLSHIPLALILLLSSSVWAQKEGNNWYFSNAGLDFNPGNPVADTSSSMSQNESVSTVSDSSGNLLFYTDGITVWDSTHQQMPNGFGLTGGFSTTQTLVVPQPMNDSIYYIFTQEEEGGPAGHRYSTVNMHANGNQGDVIIKNQPLYALSTERVCAVGHANGIDVWIISHEWNSDVFRTYLLTCTGLQPGPSSTVGPILFGVITNALGYLRPSHAGDRLAMAIGGIGTVEFFDFDKATGIITQNPLSIPLTPFTYGIEFSPDDTKLYVSHTDITTIGYLKQFDLAAGNTAAILNSETALDTTYWLEISAALQLGPDGKIYHSINPRGYISRIEFPNLAGLACTFVDSAVNLEGKSCLAGLPHSFEFLGYPHLDTARFTSTTACIGDTIWFTDASDYQPDSSLWVFGDPASGSLDTSRLQSPFHVYTSSGTFTVVRITYRSCLSDTVTQLVTVPAYPAVNLGPDTLLCDQTSYLLAGPAGVNYQWSTGDSTQNIQVNTSGTYWLEAENGGCLAGDSVNVDFGVSPSVNLGPDTSFLCTPISIDLDAGHSGSNYLWSSGDTTQVLTVSQTGSFWVAVNQNGCIGYDTILIDLGMLPLLDIGPSDTICGGDTLVLSAGSGWSQILWSGGDTTTDLSISNPGTYSVTTELNGCLQGDTIEIFIYPTLSQNLPAEIGVLCQGEQVTLDAGPDGDFYLWSNGDTTQVILVDSASLYTVMVGNSCEILLDSADFVGLALPSPDLGSDQFLCQEEEFLLGWLPDMSQFPHSFLWSNGDTNATTTVTDPGTYWVEVSNQCGFGSDTVRITLLGEDLLFIPNVITPNGDGIADKFSVQVPNPAHFQIQIWDRWGREIFTSQNPNSQWDGSYNAAPAPEGVYYFKLQTQDCIGKQIRRSGAVTLVR